MIYNNIYTSPFHWDIEFLTPPPHVLYIYTHKKYLLIITFWDYNALCETHYILEAQHYAAIVNWMQVARVPIYIPIPFQLYYLLHTM